MRFIVDECVGPAVAKWLQNHGHDTYSVYDNARGSHDEIVLAIAVEEKRILITNDKDFGDKVYRDGSLHSGVILLRLEDQSPAASISALQRLLSSYPERIDRSFTVVTEKQVRFGKSHRVPLDH